MKIQYEGFTQLRCFDIMIMLKVIYVARINKSAEVLAIIGKRKVVSQAEITSNRELLNLFTGARAKPARRIIDTAALLTKQGFLSTGTMDDGETIYKITERGLTHLHQYRTTRYSVPKTGDWHGEWYLVSFEVPEARKATRNNLILQLKRQGFVNYMKGLWAIPYNPTEFIDSLRQRLDLEHEIRIITAAKLDDDAGLRKHFGL